MLLLEKVPKYQTGMKQVSKEMLEVALGLEEEAARTWGRKHRKEWGLGKTFLGIWDLTELIFGFRENFFLDLAELHL